MEAHGDGIGSGFQDEALITHYSVVGVARCRLE
jgi:hypothetical protein